MTDMSDDEMVRILGGCIGVSEWAGVYSAERQCPDCDFKTWSRVEFWRHRATHETEQAA